MLQLLSLPAFPGTRGGKECRAAFGNHHILFAERRALARYVRKPERGGVAECRGAWKAAGNLCGQLRCRAVEMHKSASGTQFKTAFRRQSHVQHCTPRKPAA